MPASASVFVCRRLTWDVLLDASVRLTLNDQTPDGPVRTPFLGQDSEVDDDA
jgi:hypothetical protein